MKNTTPSVAQAPNLVLPVGHTNSILSVTFSPDGKLVLTGSGDNTAKLWDLSGRELQAFAGHTSIVNSVAFSPDGKQILTGSLDNTAKLWDLSGKTLQTFTGHTSSVNSVAFSPDGKQVLTGSDDGAATLWDLSGKALQTFSWRASGVNSVAFSPDGKQVLTGHRDETARLWDLSGNALQTFTGHTSSVNSVAFSPDGKQVLTGSDDGAAKLWDLSGQVLQTFKGHTSIILTVAFSPDGKNVLTGSEDDTAKLWDLSGQVLQTFKGHASCIYSVAFSPDGKQVLTGSRDTMAKLWDLSGEVSQVFTGRSCGVIAVAYSPGGQQVLTGSEDGTATLWNLSGGALQTFKDHADYISSLAFSPDGKQILTGSEDKTAKLWDLSGKVLHTFEGHTSNVSSVAFSPDGKQVLTGSGDGTAILWDVSGKALQTFAGEYIPVGAVAFSPEGKQVLIGNALDTATLCDLSGKELQKFAGHEGGIRALAFSPNGEQVLTGSRDKRARLWDRSGQVLQTFTDFTFFVDSVAFSPDGKQILTGGLDTATKLWDLSGRLLQVFAGHAMGASSVAFSPDGKTVLTGSSDNTTKLWDIHSGNELATLIRLDGGDWTITTPSGLFDASPGAMQRMHYVQDLEVIELDQLKERYYEPGLLAKVMGFDKGNLRDVAAFSQLEMFPDIDAGIDQNILTIELSERNGGLGKLSLFINNKEVQNDINPSRQKKLTVDLDTFSKYYLGEALNTVALRAYNREGWLKSQAYELRYQPAATTRGDGGSNSKSPGGFAGPPSLYAVVVGTSNYASESLKLKFADLDAEAMSKAFLAASAPLFGAERTSVKLLTTLPAETRDANSPHDTSSKTNIQKAFQDIAAKARSEDVLLVYFSGHGLAYGPAEKEQFYYLTKDIASQDLSDPAIRNNYTVSSEELTRWLTAIPAQKQVMVIDACNAGKVVESFGPMALKNLDPSQTRALDRMRDRTGMFILTGSAADKVSFEASQYGQGLLTYSLLQGMSGLALTEDKRVDVVKLFQYSCDAVPELAKGIGGVQVPVLAFPNGAGASFDIGIVGPEVNIPLAQAKPMFIRSNFQDENFGDELELMKALNDYFRRKTLPGAVAKFIYADVNEYENGHSIRGSYLIKGDLVEVRGGLFKGKKILNKFQASGKKSDVPELVKQILQVVLPMVK